MPETVEARVLLVSSNPEQVRLQADTLERVGFVVRACGPDADGFSLFDQFDPQVTVVDVSAGGAEALEFLERGRRSYPSCGFLSWRDAAPPTNGRAAEAPSHADTPDLVPLVLHLGSAMARLKFLPFARHPGRGRVEEKTVAVRLQHLEQVVERPAEGVDVAAKRWEACWACSLSTRRRVPKTQNAATWRRSLCG